MQTKHLQHRQGGRITAIHAIGHAMDRGVASWFYLGDVEWSDGGRSAGLEIAPFCVCLDQSDPAAQAEYDAISTRLTDHLARAGVWHDMKRTKDGRGYSWTPNVNGAMQIPIA